MKTVFIYSLNEPDTGECRYVGMSKNPRSRFAHHRSVSKTLRTHRDKWISSLINRGSLPVLEVLDEVPFSQWEFWEREYIRVFRAIGFRLTNHTDGGEAGPDLTGLKRPESFCASRRGARNPNFGRPITEEQKEKFRETKRLNLLSGATTIPSGAEHNRFGIPHSEETKAALSKSLKGRVRSEEHCKAIAAGHARRKQRLS